MLALPLACRWSVFFLSLSFIFTLLSTGLTPLRSMTDCVLEQWNYSSSLGTVMFINSKICHRTALSRDHLQILSLRSPRSLMCWRWLMKIKKSLDRCCDGVPADCSLKHHEEADQIPWSFWIQSTLNAEHRYTVVYVPMTFIEMSHRCPLDHLPLRKFFSPPQRSHRVNPLWPLKVQILNCEPSCGQSNIKMYAFDKWAKSH